MSSALMVECPACGARPGDLCWDKESGRQMKHGHAARSIIGLWPDGEPGPVEDDDPDEHITPLGDLEPEQQDPDWDDDYPDQTVLRWAQIFDGKTYIYVAIKAEGIGWFLSGKTTEGLTWDTLWNRHLSKAEWLQVALSWGPKIFDPGASTP